MSRSDRGKIRPKPLLGDQGSPKCGVCHTEFLYETDHNGQAWERCLCGEHPLARIGVGYQPKVDVPRGEHPHAAPADHPWKVQSGRFKRGT